MRLFIYLQNQGWKEVSYVVVSERSWGDVKVFWVRSGFPGGVCLTKGNNEGEEMVNRSGGNVGECVGVVELVGKSRK